METFSIKHLKWSGRKPSSPPPEAEWTAGTIFGDWTIRRVDGKFDLTWCDERNRYAVEHDFNTLESASNFAQKQLENILKPHLNANVSN